MTWDGNHLACGEVDKRSGVVDRTGRAGGNDGHAANRIFDSRPTVVVGVQGKNG